MTGGREEGVGRHGRASLERRGRGGRPLLASRRSPKRRSRPERARPPERRGQWTAVLGQWSSRGGIRPFVRGGAAGEGGTRKKTILNVGVPAGGASLASASAVSETPETSRRCDLRIKTARGDREIGIRLYFYCFAPFISYIYILVPKTCISSHSQL
jgi:hypothetical protein